MSKVRMSITVDEEVKEFLGKPGRNASGYINHIIKQEAAIDE